MLKVGLTGGYASGKSFVAGELERLGCRLIYADRLGHQTLEPGGGAYRQTVDAFGPGILKDDGAIDRKRLGALVFGAPELLEKLNSFVHPAVFRLEEQMIAQFAATELQGIVAVEAAILIETGRYRAFDRLILTMCKQETQIARGMHRDGLTREQVLARIARQMPIAEKAHYADFLIDTDHPKAVTAMRIKEVFTQLQEEAAQHS